MEVEADGQEMEFWQDDDFRSQHSQSCTRSCEKVGISFGMLLVTVLRLGPRAHAADRGGILALSKSHARWSESEMTVMTEPQRERHLSDEMELD